ncbi:MAG: hypothetical protein WC291_07105 [Thermodesulfovibrionales bacterium]|jgi:succinate dehydrogenase hydrophobic anchor subunit
MASPLFWLLHRITGLFLIGGLAVHFLTMSYGRLIPFGTAMRRAFLLSAIYHVFYGLWGLSVEYIRSTAVRRLIQGGIIILAIGLIALAL